VSQKVANFQLNSDRRLQVTGGGDYECSKLKLCPQITPHLQIFAFFNAHFPTRKKSSDNLIGIIAAEIND